VPEDEGKHRQAGIQETIFKTDADNRAGICGHNVLQRDNAVYAEGAEEGEHTMEALLHGAQYRKV